MQDLFKGGQESVHVRGDIVAIDEKVYFIKRGTVGLYSAEAKQRTFLFTYKAGEFFPYQQNDKLLSGRRLEYRCLSTVSLVALPRAEFERNAFMVQNIENFVRNLMSIMELQVERLDNMQQGQVFNRLIERLIFFASRLGVKHGDKIIIDSPMSHADIASSIGTSRETVNRLMRDLEKKGVLSVRNQTIIINSLEELTRLSDDPSNGNKQKIASGLLLATVVAQAAALSIGQS